jgi:hypothetical protein
MPRTQVKGVHIRDGTIKTVDLADSAVTTPKIKDKNVTEPKLADGSVTEPKLDVDVASRLLTTKAPIARVRLPDLTPAHTDIIIPGGISYSSTQEFLDRILVSVDGQLMWNFISYPPADPKDPCDVYPGSDGTKIRFAFDLDRGTKLQVVQL